MGCKFLSIKKMYQKFLTFHQNQTYQNFLMNHLFPKNLMCPNYPKYHSE
jgi:hypothetical protein